MFFYLHKGTFLTHRKNESEKKWIHVCMDKIIDALSYGTQKHEKRMHLGCVIMPKMLCRDF
jgi:hypothetical protein